MKILNLHVQKFRGIVDLSLNLNGENAVIFGPNGVGKSAVGCGGSSWSIRILQKRDGMLL